MGIILEYRDIAIPNLDAKRKRRKHGIPELCPGNYRAQPYDIDHAAANQPLVDITKAPYNIAGDPYYNRERNTIYGGRIEGSMSVLLMRQGVAELLAERNEILKRDGFEIYVRDGYRTIDTQRGGRVRFAERLRRNHPGWNDAQVTEEVDRYWAVPPASADLLDKYSPPPHMSGGVADLTLRDLATKETLGMGSVFDDVDTSAYPDHFERVCNAKIGRNRIPTYTEEEALYNRRMLYWVFEDPSNSLEKRMSVNATEIWHVSFGDQLWARYHSTPTNLVRARYPLIIPG